MTVRTGWEVWSTVAEVSTVDPSDLSRLRRIAEQTIADVDRACSRYRTDSEIGRLALDFPAAVVVSEVLARIIADALAGAVLTDGLVDPTVGSLLQELGWVAAGSASMPLSVTTRATWRDVQLDGSTVVAPAGVRFDFGATGKATARDLIIERAMADGIDAGALVSLGGDIATSRAAPEHGWVIEVQDLPGDPSVLVTLSDGAAIATSSTRRRRLPSRPGPSSHIIDPRTAAPAADTWGAVTAIAGSCAHANSATTASVVLGVAAPAWLETRGIAARLLRPDGDVVCTSHWPRAKEPAHV